MVTLGDAALKERIDSGATRAARDMAGSTTIARLQRT
jgi:hypothetical protein